MSFVISFGLRVYYPTFNIRRTFNSNNMELHISQLGIARNKVSSLKKICPDFFSEEIARGSTPV